MTRLSTGMTTVELDTATSAAASAVLVLALTTALAVGTTAIELSLTPARIEAALAVARGDATRRTAFHRPYLIPFADPLVERVEVITEVRRLVLIAEERIAGGNALFAYGTRAAEEALRPWRGKVSILVRLRFDPRNTYVLAPPLDVALVGPVGAVPQQALRSKTLFGFSTGVPGEPLPVTGAEAEADYAAAPLAQQTATLVVRMAGKDVARRAVDFRVLE